MLTLSGLQLQLQQQQGLTAQAASARAEPLRLLARIIKGPGLETDSEPVATLQHTELLLLQCQVEQMAARKAAVSPELQQPMCSMWGS